MGKEKITRTSGKILDDCHFTVSVFKHGVQFKPITGAWSQFPERERRGIRRQDEGADTSQRFRESVKLNERINKRA
jgi:hypothetical protein